MFILGAKNSSNDKVKKFVKASWYRGLYKQEKLVKIKKSKKLVKLQCQNRKKMARQGSIFFLKFIVKVNLDTFGQPQ